MLIFGTKDFFGLVNTKFRGEMLALSFITPVHKIETKNNALNSGTNEKNYLVCTVRIGIHKAEKIIPF